MFAVIGLVAFALTALYLYQDIAEGLHNRVAGWLAHQGWNEQLNVRREPIGLVPRSRRAVFRFLWKLQDCPFCMSTWVAAFASWYVIGNHLWTKVFWTTWWAAVGVAWLAVTVYKLGEEMIEEIGARREDREHAQHD